MNPFALHGASFLAFYVVTALCVVAFLHFWIRARESATDKPLPSLSDPYLIAHLRAGAHESLRVATVALLDRGLLTADDDNLKAKSTSASELVRRPIEHAVLACYQQGGEATRVFTDARALKACEEYATELRANGLIADGRVYAQRLGPALIAIAILAGIAWTKVSIAFSQGRHNVGFLIVLAVVFCLGPLVIWRRRLTARGAATLADLRELFSRLKGRAKSLRSGGQTNEAALLGAVFGLSALPADAFPFLRKLYPQKTGDSSGCGSSSSCSSGSSCGGGCGGGGCGG